MKIFLVEPIHQKAYENLKDNYEVIDDYSLLNTCEIVISRNLKIDKDFIDHCDSLKLIIIHGSGYDDVDIEYAKQKGIHLVNTPGQNALSVSELIITMMLQLSRQTTTLYNHYKDNKINNVAPIEYLGHEISYKTFGIVGVGDIAIKTLQILKDGFHMNIIGYSPSLTKDKANLLGIKYCETIEEVFINADYISIGCSLNNRTYHMIDKHYLSLMKETAYLINTSRGAIINEDDLYDILKDNKIAGAAIDVLENEPVPYNHRLLELENVLYTPHIGGSTDEALYRVGMMIVDLINKYKYGELWEQLLF
ncbi:MAG: NAD(P)-dependent oxidoreductase [Coprobacillus sp.]